MIRNPSLSRIGELLLAASLAFAVHFALLHFAGRWEETRSFIRLPEVVYGFFAASSIVIVAILLRVRQRNIDSVGQAFLLLTCVKAGAAYLVVRPALEPGHDFEKLNFFIVFAIFLAIETVISIRILNR